MEEIKNKINKICKLKGCSEAQLAKELGLNAQTLDAWKKRNRYIILLSLAIDGLEFHHKKEKL